MILRKERKGGRKGWSTSFIDEVIFEKGSDSCGFEKRGGGGGRKGWSTSFIRRSDFLEGFW